MSRQRRAQRSTAISQADHVVREAEGIVQRAWLDRLALRCRELEGALRRATDRCDAAQRSLDAARGGGDPGRIADSHRDLANAQAAVRVARRCWERMCLAFGAEAGTSILDAPEVADGLTVENDLTSDTCSDCSHCAAVAEPQRGRHRRTTGGWFRRFVALLSHRAPWLTTPSAPSAE